MLCFHLQYAGNDRKLVKIKTPTCHCVITTCYSHRCCRFLNFSRSWPQKRHQLLIRDPLCQPTNYTEKILKETLTFRMFFFPLYYCYINATINLPILAVFRVCVIVLCCWPLCAEVDKIERVAWLYFLRRALGKSLLSFFCPSYFEQWWIKYWVFALFAETKRMLCLKSVEMSWTLKMVERPKAVLDGPNAQIVFGLNAA